MQLPPLELGRTMAAALAHVAPGSVVTLRGHVHRRRDLATVTFLVLRDRTGLAQVVFEAGAAELPPEETPVEVIGTAAASDKAPSGMEVIDATVNALSDPAETPPFDLWRPQLKVALPTLLDHAPLSWRHLRQRAKWQIGAASLRGFRRALDAQGFTEICTPKLVESATESGANVFPVDYFGKPAFLAQSPQFYKQQLVGAFERVYEVGPVFRAEPHDTARHLAEYVSLDVELGFIRDHRDVLDVLHLALEGMLDAIRADAAEAVDRLHLVLPTIPEQIPVIHFADALAMIGAAPDEPDLAPEHERALSGWARDEFGSDVLAVEGYPLRKRPFYTHPWTRPPQAAGGWSNSFDLLFRGLELVTGGQRLHRYDDYLTAIEQRGESPSSYSAYLEPFRHGMPPHGGFAIGLERWIAQLTNSANLREATLFPRDLNRLSP